MNQNVWCIIIQHGLFRIVFHSKKGYLYPKASTRLQVCQRFHQDSLRSKGVSAVELTHANFEMAKTEQTLKRRWSNLI